MEENWLLVVEWDAFVEEHALMQGSVVEVAAVLIADDFDVVALLHHLSLVNSGVRSIVVVVVAVVVISVVAGHFEASYKFIVLYYWLSEFCIHKVWTRGRI